MQDEADRVEKAFRERAQRAFRQVAVELAEDARPAGVHGVTVEVKWMEDGASVTFDRWTFPIHWSAKDRTT